MSKSKILFKMTGSIACYKACGLISQLVQKNYDVQVVASHSALKFVGAATLEGLTGKAVLSDTFESGSMMSHIHLMRWADLIIVAPATAHFINKAAQGSGEDLIHNLFLAHDFKKPYLIASAMNTSMYLHPVTQESLKKLKSMGIDVLESASGVLACGENGWGRLLEPDLLMKEIEQRLKPQSKTSLGSVLVTSGGTQEPIDDVRCITNKSTGRTGSLIAETLTSLGYEVTYLHAETAVLAKAAKLESFTSFASLEKKLKQLLAEKSYQAVIHTAAISDYSVADVFDGKMSSSGAEEMNIRLKRNPKLINQLKDWSRNKAIKVIGFKLTAKASAEQITQAVGKLFSQAQADLVVHNDTTEMSKDQHVFYIYNNKEKLAKLDNPKAMSEFVAQYLGGPL